ncbi:MAG: tRNA pseudouridine32 synthase/23S rRNA pseudouridine746 synthase [Paraglaciecola sp.]
MNSPDSLFIELVYDHLDFIVVNKPAGIAVQDEEFSVGILVILCQQLQREKLWLVHRLDKVTSGLLILAKTAQAAANLGKLFEARHIEKFYIALSSQKPKKKQGCVSGGMKKIRDGKWALAETGTSPAITQFFSKSVAPGIRVFLLKPVTGKTHQLRVMLKSLGSPILGDTFYKGDQSDRTYLHAYSLRFQYQGDSISIQCLPNNGAYFQTQQFTLAVQQYLTPWLLTWPVIKQVKTGSSE